MNFTTLQTILSNFKQAKVGVLGDFCMDAYWTLDQGDREISIETGKPTYAVRKQQYSLGGAGNIIANLAALEVGFLKAVGIVGDDLFGREMTKQLASLGVDHSAMIVQKGAWETAVYGKPYLGEEELDRIDFGRFNQISQTTEAQLIKSLQTAIDELDLLILNRQLQGGVYSEKIWHQLLKWAKTRTDIKFLLDFRELPQKYEQMIVKLNAKEAARYCDENHENNPAVESCKNYAKIIYKHARKPVIITRGEKGLFSYDGKHFHFVAGILINKPIDPVGAGDTSISTLAASIASDTSFADAARLANYAAAISIQKIRQTGTASQQEILQISTNTKYIHHPDLANNIRLAKYWKDSSIEIVNPAVSWGHIKWAILDHDGTLSVLREGWEQVMQEMMTKNILGTAYDSVAPVIRKQIQQRASSYISQSTGIQTIMQMKALAKMVAEYGYVPKEQIGSPETYKEQFTAALSAKINQRKTRIEQKTLVSADLTVKGAIDFIHTLANHGIKLALLSGTDHEEVKKEATLLGYAPLFEGRIFGALPHSNKHEKKQVIARIKQEHQLSNREILALGDGPDEIRATKSLGGIAIGIASDEVRRYGLNLTKRKNLIEAGADVMISDYSELDQLVALLRL